MRYQPINCEFHDVLEATASRGTVATLLFRDAHGATVERVERILDVFAQQGAEYLQLSSGERIRLDAIVSLDGMTLASFPLASA
ncbi:MAG TPA: hypothetical protein VM469_05435 [Pseudoxanthomonas sp.]|jgi:Rho-binding antiterminator|nr:hypothetical protein [Pseudoxanthomonas sp.]